MTSELVPGLEPLADANVPTRFGTFRFHVYHWHGPKPHPALSDEQIALVMGDVRGKEGVPLRIHSECLTSEVFGSLKCDCKEQLDGAQEHIAQGGLGVVLYLRQEGRGIGLANKIRAYALQEQGADTIEANERLHLPVDARTYDVAAAMIRHLGIQSIQLITNNPEKVAGLEALGVEVASRIPMVIQPNQFSAGYLDVKRNRMAHHLPTHPNGAAHPQTNPNHK